MNKESIETEYTVAALYAFRRKPGRQAQNRHRSDTDQKHTKFHCKARNDEGPVGFQRLQRLMYNLFGCNVN